MLTRLIVALVAALLLAGPAAAQAYVWHEAIPGESVQYGVPDSDDRALRIDCEGRGKIAIVGPTASEAPNGERLIVLLRSAGGPARRVPGVVVEMGDGSNFEAVVPADDPAVIGLLTGKDLTVGSAGDSWTVPAKSAKAPLTRLLAACAARKG